jgi:hypothetical protein
MILEINSVGFYEFIHFFQFVTVKAFFKLDKVCRVGEKSHLETSDRIFHRNFLGLCFFV